MLRQTRLSSQQFGSGFPLLLIPGAWGRSLTDFQFQIDQFAPHFQVIAVDPPGYGNSRPPHRNFSGNFFERDALSIAAHMSSLGHRRYHVLGWSDGGIVAMFLAARKPRHIASLVACAANSSLNDDDLAVLDLVRNPSAWSPAARERVSYLTAAELSKGWTEYCDRLSAFGRRGGDICSSILGKIACPCLVLHGESDMVTSPRHAPFLRDRIARASMWIFENAGHDVHRTHAAEFNARVLEFLATAHDTVSKPKHFAVGR